MPNGTICLGSPYVWTPASPRWNQFIRNGDASAVVMPELLASNDPAGTYNWSVTFYGAGSSVTKSFSVTNNAGTRSAVSPPVAAATLVQPSISMQPYTQTQTTQPMRIVQQQVAAPTSTMPSTVSTTMSAFVVNGVAGSYSTTTTPYQPTIALSGSGFNTVTQISWSCTMPSGASCGNIAPWTSSNWNGKFIRYSDTQAVVAPMLLVSTDPRGTYHWGITFYGAGSPVTKVFSVTKN